MAVSHSAAPDDDVLSWHVDPSTISVPSGFDRDAVVPSIEITTLYQNVRTRFWITAIIVRTMTIDPNISDCDVCTKHRMQLPHW
jgi:hypothetical protein